MDASSLKKIKLAFWSFNLIVYLVVALLGLAVCVFFLNQTLESASNIERTSTPEVFDKATIERLKQLNKESKTIQLLREQNALDQ